MAQLNWATYCDKTLGCWMGKNGGGTLGGPVEGRREILDLDWYPKVQEGGIPNDDLEVQLVWLHALETRGVHLTAEDLAAEWLDHYLPNWCEYGFGKTNVRKGLLPPLSGAFNNWFSESMGCPIRAEIWACVAPGLPLKAARLAREDAVVDHTNDSAYAEMLYAVIESAAYLEEDRDRLMELGLAAIPDDSRTARAVRVMMDTWTRTHDWGTTRQAILDAEGRYDDFTDAPQNIAFTLLGWYTSPRDFGKAICDSVNCGFDTDCTGATLGAILGVAWGAQRLPARWMEPLGNTIAVESVRTRLTDLPRTLEELTDRTAAVAIGLLAGEGYAFGPGRALDLELPPPEKLRAQMREAGLWDNPTDAVERRFPHGRVVVRYPEGPLLAPGGRRRAAISLTNETERPMEGPVCAAGLAPGLTDVALTPACIDLAPGEAIELTLALSLADDAPPRGHVEAAVAVLAEGIAPWTFPVSFLRPMHWRLQRLPLDAFGEPVPDPPAVDGDLVAVEGNRVPLPAPGTWRGQTRVHNPSSRERQVRLCCPSNLPVRVWLNGRLAVDNPGSERIMPSYHCNGPQHYGSGVLRPGWNDLSAEWQQRGTGGESHLFLTDPGGTGWGDLVFGA